jgi:hypothetical protein
LQSPATNSFNQLRGFLSVPQTPINSQSLQPALFGGFVAIENHLYNFAVGLKQAPGR